MEMDQKETTQEKARVTLTLRIPDYTDLDLDQILKKLLRALAEGLDQWSLTLERRGFPIEIWQHKTHEEPQRPVRDRTSKEHAKREREAYVDLWVYKILKEWAPFEQVPYEKLINICAVKDIKPNEVRRAVKGLKARGQIYEPRKGFLTIA